MLKRDYTRSRVEESAGPADRRLERVPAAKGYAVIVERFMWSAAWHDPRLAGWPSMCERRLTCAGCERKIDRNELHDGRLLCEVCRPPQSAAVGS